MCGRTCLTLEPWEVQACCKYQHSLKNSTPTSDFSTPEYRNEFNCGRQYQPSHNLAPTDITPVLVSASHFDDHLDSSHRIIVPMMWSMVPRWHKGDYRKHGLTTNNCRLEKLAVSKLYQPALDEGQRCVILCEGFYEWQTTKPLKASERPAFYVHMPQKKSVQIEEKSTWGSDIDGVDLLKMAGLFDVWENENGDKLYSYTVITFESNKHFSQIHHRIPAILETEDEVAAWLDYRRVAANQALNKLKPSECIQWYQVSNLVNNSRNKSHLCNKPLKQAKRSSKLMDTWLNTSKADDLMDDKKEYQDEPKDKKIRLDDTSVP